MELLDIPDKEYFALDAFSNSAAKLLLRSPLHYSTNDFQGSSPTRIGTAVHCLILTPGDFEKTIKVFNGTKTLTSKAAKSFVADHPDHQVITQDEADKAQAICEARTKNDLDFFGRISTEKVILGEINGVKVKAKYDAYCDAKGLIYDIKTTESLTKFRRSFYDLGYHTQAYFYTMMMRKLGKEINGFIFYVIETNAPYCHGVFDIDDEVLEDGKNDINRAMEIYKQCKASGNWSQGYSNSIETLTRPYYRR